MKPDAGKDTPNWLLSLAERTPWQERFIISGLIRVIAGSDSESYLQARWHAVEELVNLKDEETGLPVAAADPDAGVATAVMPRLKTRAAVVAANGEEFETIRGAYSHTRREPAVVYEYRGEAHAGVIPRMEQLGKLGDSYSAALRTGRSDFGVGLGVWVPKERIVVVPEDMHIVEQNLPVNRLPGEYPGTPLL